MDRGSARRPPAFGNVCSPRPSRRCLPRAQGTPKPEASAARPAQRARGPGANSSGSAGSGAAGNGTGNTGGSGSGVAGSSRWEQRARVGPPGRQRRRQGMAGRPRLGQRGQRAARRRSRDGEARRRSRSPRRRPGARPAVPVDKQELRERRVEEARAARRAPPGGGGTAGAPERPARPGPPAAAERRRLPEGRRNDPEHDAAVVDDEPAKAQWQQGLISPTLLGGTHLNQPAVFNGYLMVAGNEDFFFYDVSNATVAEAAVEDEHAQPPGRRRGRVAHDLVRARRQHVLHGHAGRHRHRHLGRHQRDARPSTSRSSRSRTSTTATTPRRSGASRGRDSTSTSAPPTTASRSSTRPIPRI